MCAARDKTPSSQLHTLVASLALRPSNVQRGCLDGQHLSRACLRNLGNLIHATPLRRYHEQRFLAWATQNASEAAAVEADCLHRLAAFANTDAAIVGHICVPNTLFGV